MNFKLTIFLVLSQGWYLVLDVDADSQHDRLLPCPPRQPLVQYNLSEFYSAPGSQAASMINSTHLRSLETPLSAVATATSLAETDPAMAKSIDGKDCQFSHFMQYAHTHRHTYIYIYIYLYVCAYVYNEQEHTHCTNTHSYLISSYFIA